MYQPFIGLEIHISLLTKTKVFCSCRAAFGDAPNSNICPGCMAYPGTLPSLNIEALRMGAAVARALNCEIPEKTWFDRKQYFYPDLSKNYQITQFFSPIGQRGYFDIEGASGGKEIKKRVRIKECHVEENAGKMIHSGASSLLDDNRGGAALLEVVTEPDLESGEEAELFVQQFRRLVRYLGVCDGNMEEGSLRADANVSVNLLGAGLGRRVEVKNLNSSRFIKLAVNYELERHARMMDSGEVVAQQTRFWNEAKNETVPMREKESASDYRYFQDPDLPVFFPDAEFLESVESALVELPLGRAKRLAGEAGLPFEKADLICEEKEIADYFEAVLNAASDLPKEEAAQRAANWLLQDIKHVFGKAGLEIRDIASSRLSAARLASLVSLAASGKITGKNAKQCLEAVLNEDKDPAQIAAERGWEIIADPEVIAQALAAVAQAEAAVIEELKGPGITDKRRQALAAFMTGKVLAATGGKADPKITGRLVSELVSGG